MALKEAAEIFKSLRTGTVPERGLEAFAVGVERHRKELQRTLTEVRDGAGDSRFLRGGYGCGKTFMSTLVRHDAQAMGFVTSSVVVSVNDLHFHKFEELYRHVINALSTPACPQGALGDILDRWIGGIEEHLLKLDPDADADGAAFDQKVLAKLDEHLTGLTGGKVPADMVRVVRKIFELKQAGKVTEAMGLVSWLSGSTSVGMSIKNLAGIKGEVSSSDALAYLRGVLEIIRSAGYKGLVIVIDETETLLRERGDVRGKSLNGIRQIVDSANSYKGLLWVFTGTPMFFDDRQGVKGVEALHTRIKYEEFNGVASLRQPQLALKPFDKERLLQVALKLRSIYPELSAEEAERRLPKSLLEQLVNDVSSGFNNDVGVVPRQFLRKFVGILEILADNEDVDAHQLLGFKPEDPSPEEAAVLAGRKLDEPPPDDGFGGANVEI